MFKLESYITPIILNHVAKYVKNIRPQDATFSLWEGEVSFQNLDLRLDVLEEELKMPFEFLSGHIHELSIHVPWTKITSEPIKIVINTIEFVLKLKNERTEGASSSASSSPHRSSADAQKRKRFSKQDEQQQQAAQQTVGSGMVNKIINNITVQCHNIILKYVEDDIVVSMNVQLLSFGSADERWKPAMVDVHPVKVLMRKLVQISDLTICLDKRNAAGQIDVCQEPILYRCTLECRIIRKYNVNFGSSTSTTRIGVFTKQMDLNVSSLQFPMVMRLFKLMLALKTGKFKDPHIIESICDGEEEQDSPADAGGSYLAWAWNMLPSFNFDFIEEDDQGDSTPSGHTMDIGIYVEQLNFSLKNSEFVNDSIMGNTKRIRYTPIIRICLGGIYFESVSASELGWHSLKAGVSTIFLEPLGTYRSDEKSGPPLIETAPFNNERAFIDKSLFDDKCQIADKGWGVTSYEEYVARITDEYLLFRSPTLSFDSIEYKALQCDDDATESASQAGNDNPPTSGDGSSSKGDLVCTQKYRLLSSGITFRYNQSFLQVKHVINDFIDSYDYPAYYAEKLEAVAASGNAVKLHPPLMEDYDALMQHIPLCTYKFNLRKMGIEIYAKAEPEGNQKTHRRLPQDLKQALPNFLLHFEQIDGVLTTPLKPDQLVHTTCQLPEKPMKLLNACYDNYTFNVKDCSVSLISKVTLYAAKLIYIPKLQLCYSNLLQQQHWNDVEVPQRKFEVSCERLNVQFSKRELVASQRLLDCIFSFRPYLIWKVARQSVHPSGLEDPIKLQNTFLKFYLQWRRYRNYANWDTRLRGLFSELVFQCNPIAENHLVLKSKVKNTTINWLECQAQLPCSDEGSIGGEEEEINTVIGLWLEPFRIFVDTKFLEFLEYYEERVQIIEETDSAVEIELRTQSLQPSNLSTTGIPPTPTAAMPTTSSATQAHTNAPASSTAMPPLMRRSSRNSLPSRKVSQPEETIHLSSERDEKVDMDVLPNAAGPPKAQASTSWFKFMKLLILNIEIEQSKIDIAENFTRNSKGKFISEYTRLVLPKVVLKSTQAAYITRSEMQLKIALPPANVNTVNWIIGFNDFEVKNRRENVTDIILNGIYTSVTIAFTHKAEKIFFESSSSTLGASHSDNREAPLEGELEENFDSFDAGLDDFSVSNHRHKEKPRNNPISPQPVRDVVTFNLHADTTPIHFFMSVQKVKTLQKHLSILIKVVHLMQTVTSPNASSTLAIADPIQIVTASEESQNLKEFLELETSSQSSMLSDNRNTSSHVILIFCQWTITRIIVELKSSDSPSQKSKLILELEDLLSTVDKREDFIKYTSKIGQLNINYFKSQEVNLWELQKCLRVKMLGETTNMPFLNIIYTSVSLKNFYSRIGAKRRGINVQRSISEIIITTQAIELIIDVDSIVDFIAPLCVLLEKTDSYSNYRCVGGNLEPGKMPNAKPVSNPMSSNKLPLIHLDSKGLTCYLPLKTGKKCCSVAVLKIESIKITPNLENPLQRNPIRTDVWSKAAQVGFLNTPGSIVEDRQYELTIRNISAATGNWDEILAHMLEEAKTFNHTNPALEWNNQERKTALQLTDIFANFTFIVIFAPCIVYNNVLICGQAIEFNCASDLVASVNTMQLNLISCMTIRLLRILDIINDITNPPKQSKSSSIATLSDGSKNASNNSSVYYSTKSLQTHRSVPFSDMRGGTSTLIFDSIDENTECNVKTDSGFQSCLSNSVGDRVSDRPEQQRNDHYSAPAIVRYMPHTLSLVAGDFFVRMYGVRRQNSDITKNIMKKSTHQIHLGDASFGNDYDLDAEDYDEEDEDCAEELLYIPLVSIAISQPSFMITQNINDSITQVSLFNLSISLAINDPPQLTLPTPDAAQLFPEFIFDTRTGELGATGIPPPLCTFKLHRTKMQIVEMEGEICKNINVTLNEQRMQRLCKHLITMYESVRDNPCFNDRSARVVVVRTTKIKLLRQQFFNADRMLFKCDRIKLVLKNETDYDCKFVCADMLLNVKFLNRPEKITLKAAIGSFHLQTGRKIFLHPVAVRLSADLVDEPWYPLPLVIATAKFNVVHFDVGIYSLRELRQALQGMERVRVHVHNNWAEFVERRDTMTAEEAKLRERLVLLSPHLKQPKANSKKNTPREEFYQDDLRAGAFQFVDMITDTFLPLPYQIQIIKKNCGIICWRYPQPRKMCKIYIYPVPMAVPKPIHIKCRIEYFSDTHESFLHYCDFWLSETDSKQIKLPEREICSNIWRVVILQSLVSVNGDCFAENSESDDDLHMVPNIKLHDALNTERKDADYILHPKVLVGCMRIDTSFQSKCVPKVQLLVSCSSLQVKLLNQPDANGELPALIKSYRLAQTTQISQTFLVLLLERLKFHASFLSTQHYTLDSNVVCSIKCIDYGFLNMLHLLEQTTLECYLHVDKHKRSVVTNVVLDKLRLNLGPSIIHSLLSSKTHWEELLNPDEKLKRHALIPKCIVVNQTYSHLSFGQTGTTERIHLEPKECHLYYFHNDYHGQELTFFIADDETQIIDASQSVPIRFKFDGQTMLQPIRIGDKCIIVKSTKLSATQIYVLIKGQIELVSMVPHELRLEFRREDKKYDEKNLLEYGIEQNGCGSFYRKVHFGSNMIMRLKFKHNKGKARTGDIPLRPNKNLPWLVKVPTINSEFISLWVRVVRETIPNLSSDNFEPQKILITIWPIFEICSMLSTPFIAEESITKQQLQVAGKGGRAVLDIPATHVTEHDVKFNYNFPLSTQSKDNYTLTLKSMEWNKFFSYDEHLWTIEDALHYLSKENTVNWPLYDEEEIRIQRSASEPQKTDINYKCIPAREFACAICLRVSPWGMFINATGRTLSVSDTVTDKYHIVYSNYVSMLANIDSAFTVGILKDSISSADCSHSSAIYFDEKKTKSTSSQFYTVTEKSATEIVIMHGSEVFKFLLEMKIENECRIFKIRSKYAITNFTKAKLSVLSFAMDHKENATLEVLMALNEQKDALELQPVSSLENCVGLTLDSFHDLNTRKLKRSRDTAYVSFVCLKVHGGEKSDISIPIPLSLPFTRRCFSIQHDGGSIPLVVTLIEKNGVYYLNVFEDVSPAILVSNETDVKFIIAQTSASENSKVSNVTPEFDGRHFEWFQVLPERSECYYTPPELYASFPDVESTMCNLTIALYKGRPTKKDLRWSKPIRTDKTWEKFLHVPLFGDVKVSICDKHRVIRVSIYYIVEQMEFSVKDLRSRLLTPQFLMEADCAELLAARDHPIDEFTLQVPQDKCMHFSQDCETKTQLKLRFFVKEIVLSLHTDSKECDYIKSEIFSMYVDDFICAYDDDDDHRELNILLPNLQIDNQLHSTGKYDFPVVLCAQELYQRDAIVPQVHYLEHTYQNLRSRSSMAGFSLNFFEDELKLNSIVCRFSPIRAYIEDAYLNELLDAIFECEPSNCVYKPTQSQDRFILLAGELLLPRDVAAQAVCIAEPLQLRSFQIEPLNMLLSVHTSVRLYIALDHSPLSFSTYTRHQILTMPLRFGQSLGMHYLSGAIFGAGWVVGSLEILGSPSGLARSFSTGLRDFVSMPVEGLFRGPWGFIVGITQGSTSLLRNVTAGTLNSVTKLASSVARNLDRLTLDQEHIERTEALRRLRPHGFTQGFSQGITGLGISILGAVGGLARHTLEARTPVEIVTGMGKGLVGAFTKPISGAAELLALTGQGVLHTVGFNAMPEQRVPMISQNMAIEPSAYRIWKLLPGVLASDQILFNHEVTLVMQDQLRRGYAFLTSAVFAIMEAQCDNLVFVFPVDKVEMSCDREDKTLFYVQLVKEKGDIEEDINYTNQRIMTFLHSSFSIPHMTTDSLQELLQNQEHELQEVTRRKLDWSFYINEHLGEHIIKYLKILKTNN